MEKYIIAIAGGSGCGKSTLAYSLKDRFPDLIEVVHFDDYHKKKEDLPLLNGMRNWDHPDAINFSQLYDDLKKLISGKDVEIMTKSSILNPEYEEKGRIHHLMQSKKIIIIEGYMVLLEEKIRKLCNLKIYLDIPLKLGLSRRDKVTYYDEDEYNKIILSPMQKKYVEPTKEFADIVIDVEKNSKEDVQKIVINKLKEEKVI
ncbi:dephospho-CoA kinase [Candidatus Woesearchaeota archaeon]|nr:dephospho-CoA kinase [Candidatus Woesearchaeota archaeon]